MGRIGFYRTYTSADVAQKVEPRQSPERKVTHGTTYSANREAD